MNNTNPFVPQGSSLWEQQKIKARARLRVAVFCTLSISILGLMALLIQGCRKPTDETPIAQDTTNPPALDLTNPVAADTTPATSTTVSNPTPPLPAMQEYSVVAGDTLSGIATKFGLPSWKLIVDANPGLDPNKLHLGQKLKIPPPPAATPSTATSPTAVTAGGGEMYTVKSGDTLSGIASAHHTTVKAITAENNLTTSRITVGQKLKIPKPTTTTTATNTP